jgi:drug/metabolite transporter (DMT)-like permease
MNETVIIAVSLGSALAAATSSVLQHRSARRAPHNQAHRLLGHLIIHPLWMAGLAAAGIGLLLHAVALAHGQLALVQPLLISGVLFAFPLSALLEGKRPSGREWLWALILVAGLAAFLIAARPGVGRVGLDADTLAWATAASVGVIAVLTLVGWRWHKIHAPALLGAAAGTGYGVVAALLKQTTAIAQSGLPTLLTDWPLYALVAMGAASLALTQIAYRAGPLAHSMPALTVSDPAVSIALGILAFGEGLSTEPVSIVVQVIGFLMMLSAATQLARRAKSDHHDYPVPVGPPASL